jgi:hypothetical protein
MNASTLRRSSALQWATAILASSTVLVANAASPLPDPCKLVTVAEMEKIVGPLAEAPRATDEKTTCSYAPAKGLSFVDVSLHEGDLAAMRRSDSQKNAVPLPDFGKDAFVNPNFHDYADLYAKKGNLIVRVTVPMGPTSVDMVKAIARKALARL